MTGRPRGFDWDRAAQMLEDGYTLEGITRELGCTHAALWNARVTLGLQARFRKGPAPLDTERVEWLTREGLSARQIAERLGVCRRTVERARARLKADRG